MLERSICRHGRQHRGRPHRVPRQRSRGDLSDHAVVDDGRAGRRLGRGGHQEHLGQHPGGAADAVRGRCCRCGARLAAKRCANHDLHRVAGPAADAAQHVQDRRRTDAVRVPRCGTFARDAGAVDLRRSLRRDERTDDRLCHARRSLGAGRARPRAGRAGRDAGVACADHAFLRRLSHVARGEQDLGHSRRCRSGR